MRRAITAVASAVLAASVIHIPVSAGSKDPLVIGITRLYKNTELHYLDVVIK